MVSTMAGRSGTRAEAQVIVLGAGYAGFTAARGLRDAGVRVILVNPFPYHYFTTLLHEPIARPRALQRIAVPLAPYLPANVQLLLGRAVAVDPERPAVEVEEVGTGTRRWLTGDFLVMAVGSEPAFFGITGLAERALTIRDLRSAPLIRTHIEHRLALYASGQAPAAARRVVIGGGGFTGVEVAAELADVRQELAAAVGVRPDAIEIFVVEAAPTLLPGLDPALVDYVHRFLERCGVHVITGVPLKEVAADGVLLADGRRIEAATVIWTGGVRAHRLVEQAGLEVDRRGRALAEPDLTAKGFPRVFVVGDVASFPGSDGRPLPPTAQVAIQEGEYLATALKLRLRGAPVPPFRPRWRGTVISLGSRDGVGWLNNRYRITGKAARALKNMILWRYLYKIGGPRLVSRAWAGAGFSA